MTNLTDTICFLLLNKIVGEFIWQTWGPLKLQLKYFGLSTQVCNNAIMNSVTIFINMKIFNIGGDRHGTSKFISE